MSLPPEAWNWIVLTAFAAAIYPPAFRGLCVFLLVLIAYRLKP